MKHDNMTQVLNRHFQEQPDKPCLRFRREGAWHDISWGETGRRTRAIAGGLCALGLEPGDRAAILSANGPEWALADLGTILAGVVNVMVYADLKADEVAYILEHSECRAVFAGDESQAAKVLSQRDRLPRLERIILFSGSMEGEEICMTLDALEAKGIALGASERVARTGRSGRDTPLTLVYTSGTTGTPKGAVLTHGNILGVVEAVEEAFGPKWVPDLTLSFLPLAHVLGRVGSHFMVFYLGGTIALASSMLTVADDLRETRPDFATAVPRFFEKVHARIQSEVAKANPRRQAIFQWALEGGLERSRCLQRNRPVPLGLRLRCALADRLVFSKIRARMGGRIRYFVCGGAPLNRDLAEFFHAVGLLICEGYGSTETAAPITFNVPLAYRFGSVGRPLPGSQVRIDEDGEILVKGSGVFPGYFKNPDATRASFTEDGFFRTGDIGRVDEDGYVYVTDRKKELIITAAGKNIPPQKVENLLRGRPGISNALVYGDRRPYLVALITIDRPSLAEFRPEFEHSPTDSPEIREWIQQQVDAVNEALPRFEQLKDFRVLDQDFTPDSGDLTLTFKLKRRVIESRYREAIDEMYAAGAARMAARREEREPAGVDPAPIANS